jgi:hypothetical protein
MTLADSWSRGVLIGLPLAAVALLAAVAGCVIFGVVAWKDRDGYDSGAYLGASVISALTALVIVGATVWGMWPFKAEYHQWTQKSGTVTDVSSRFLAADKSTEQKFVVHLDDGQEYGCNDTRCSLVKVGDFLTLSCKRTWQFSGTDGWDCNYVARRGGGS